MKVVVTEFVTLDGVFQDPGGAGEFDRGGWAFRFDRGSEGDKFKLDELIAADAQLLGRKTYDGFAAAWPSMTDEAGFAEKMNSMPKYVVSSTLTEPTWNNTTVIGFDDVAKLRAEPGGDLLVAGSGRLVQALLASGLVDELHLMVFPVVLGAGRRLLEAGSSEAPFELLEARPSGQTTIMVLRAKRE